jgi:hypothetical protein
MLMTVLVVWNAEQSGVTEGQEVHGLSKLTQNLPRQALIGLLSMSEFPELSAVKEIWITGGSICEMESGSCEEEATATAEATATTGGAARDVEAEARARRAETFKVDFMAIQFQEESSGIRRI